MRAIRVALTQAFLSLILTFFAYAQPTNSEVIEQKYLNFYAECKKSEVVSLAKNILIENQKISDPNDKEIAIMLNALGAANVERGYYPGAEALLRCALALRLKWDGFNKSTTATYLNSLGVTIFRGGGNITEAYFLMRRAIEVAEPSDSADYILNFAAILVESGKLLEAESQIRKAKQIYESNKKTTKEKLGYTLNALAYLLMKQGRDAEAEPIFKQALEIAENVPQSKTSELTSALNISYSLGNLAQLYDHQGRFSEAEALYERSLDIRRKLLKPSHPDIAEAIYNLSFIYSEQGNYTKAAKLSEEALQIAEQGLPEGHPHILIARLRLGALYQCIGRISDGEILVSTTLTKMETSLPADHPYIQLALRGLADIYLSTNRSDQALLVLHRVRKLEEASLPADHPEIENTLTKLGVAYFDKRDFREAVNYARQAMAISIARAAKIGVASEVGITSRERDTLANYDTPFLLFLGAAWTMANAQPELLGELGHQAFTTAQLITQSSASAAMTQMSVRLAKRDGELANFIREQQNLLSRWRQLDRQVTSFSSSPPETRNSKSEALVREELMNTARLLSTINNVITAKFPDYALQAISTPVGYEETKAFLQSDEALVFFLDLERAVMIFVVTSTDMVWGSASFDEASLADEILALRCGLDTTAWQKEPKDCAKITNAKPIYNSSGEIVPAGLPFNHERAYKLYKSLFGQVEKFISGKHLLIVPSGPLTQLPFQVLVTERPASADNRKVAWLARDHAITVLPSVSSLKALRRMARPSADRKAMAGFGNPLLNGPNSSYVELAELARDKQRCPQTLWQKVASLVGLRAGVPVIQTRGGLANVAALKKTPPLPDTADEICAVAKDVGANENDIFLGSRATEHEIKKLSAQGVLAQYRILHFATHGALAGDVKGNAEPGLILTPPDTPSEDDDGYLTASEIAGLRLDADWVILSACNTAAGGAQSAEALSGLARAFIYAQARALLVSHWEVDSAATVKLVTDAIKRLAADKGMGRAEAMRQSMLSLIEKGELQEAHPAFWAPFVVVGEGGAAR